MIRIQISVREIVQFVLRSGSIDARYMSAKRALEGTRIHQKIQKARRKQALLDDQQYDSEVKLSISTDYEEFQFLVEGRADGVWQRTQDVAIEEIKSTLQPVEDWIDDPKHWHWAQAKCYGHMLCNAQGLNGVSILLTYCHVDTGDMRTFEQVCTAQELQDFFYHILTMYYAFAQMDAMRIRERNDTAESLAFPFTTYRKGQRELAVSVYKTIQLEKKLFAQAPTGTGKTISTLYPSVKALQAGYSSRIFYATAKTVTRQVAEEACAHLEAKGLRMRSITLTAKDKICFCPTSACNPVECQYADGHFDRINDALIDIISNETSIKREVVEAYAQKHRLCPFEYSFDVALFCDCIICDYNYIYDPKVYMKRFFLEDGQDYIILNDEAHNLVDRAREMFSAALVQAQFLTVRKTMKEIDKKIYKSLGKISKWFTETKKGFELERVITTEEEPIDLYHLLRDFTGLADAYLAKVGDARDEELLMLYFAVLDFLKTAEFFDSHYIFYKHLQNRELQIKLLCLDPSYLLALTHKKVRCSVFFSATLTPIPYFQGVLGGMVTDFTLRLPSPFERDNLCLLIDNTISTLYKNREYSYTAVADNIHAMISGRVGNYFVFFSSYEYLRCVLDIFQDKYPSVQVLVQEQNMAEADRATFLSCFSTDNTETLVGFNVLGGIFSEGIDLAGERLIGVAVVGVGLPMITSGRNVVADYYKKNDMDGFDYAYVYPGFNKVMQAAGRVIRTETDRGVLLLMDTRFFNTKYRNLFPYEWAHSVRVKTSGEITAHVKNFWNIDR